jgi:hypothetical protein
MDANANTDFNLNINSDVVCTPTTSRNTAASSRPLSPSVLDPELSKYLSGKKTKSTKQKKGDEEDPEGTLATIK